MRNFIIFVTLSLADIQGRQDVSAMATLTGVVHARAYASAREPLQRAITDLKVCFNILYIPPFEAVGSHKLIQIRVLTIFNV